MRTSKSSAKNPGRVRRKVKISLHPEQAFATEAESETTPVASDTKGPWIELFPAGIAVNSGVGRPLLILKDKAGNDVLPVWMHPLDAGVALAELSENSGLTPHVVTRKVLSAVGYSCEKCTFVDLVGHHQYVQLAFAPVASLTETTPEMSRKPFSLRLRADEAMSFCLQSKARFFSTAEYMSRCRVIQSELGQLEEGLNSGQLSALKSELETTSKKNPYMM